MMDESNQNKSEYYRHIPEEAIRHAKAARAEMRKSFAALLPPDFLAHRKQARREMLLAAREMINHALERMETHPEDKD
ncbi:MAG: hypothetical protein JSV42_13905 [Chloroflexota bacterium]|nr:MAG: hypothetical protein JSV42_13905 [Chloroflexota bacterium]